MKILSTQYTLKYKALEIYTAGCKGPHCRGCHNEMSWDFSQGEFLEDFIETLQLKLNGFDSIIEKVMIFGGEPLDNSEEDVITLLKTIKEYKKEIWLFTRYDLNEISEKIKELCDYIKTGRYDENKIIDNHIEYGIKLSTSNQHIFKLFNDF